LTAGIAGSAPHRDQSMAVSPHLSDPAPFRRLTIFEMSALAGYYGQGTTAGQGRRARKGAWMSG